MHLSLHNFFFLIFKEHFEKYIMVNQLYLELTNNNDQWDILSKTVEQNHQYFSYFQERQKHSIVSLVFLVMAVEGLINEYGFIKLGDKRFKELERESIVSKITSFYEEVTGNTFPKETSLYQNLNDLITVRNTLVHSKSVEIDLNKIMQNEKMANEQFITYINSLVGNKKTKVTKQKNIDEVLVKTVNVYTDLKKLLQK